LNELIENKANMELTIKKLKKKLNET